MTGPADRRIDLTFDDNGRVPLLYGPHDVHLARIENQLGVTVISRGNRLTVAGPAPSVEVARTALEALWERTGRGLAVDAAEVDAALRLASSAAPDVPAMETARGDLAVRTRRRVITPRSATQARYLTALAESELVFGLGPAGTGKTYLAVAQGVSMLVAGQVDRIILSRPAVEAGERLGFLPGDLAQTVDPYPRPLYDALYDLLGFERTAKLFERQSIEIAPLAYMRGRTLNHAFIILDEAQNTTPEQMKMFLTRMGFGSRAVVTGDTTQVDLPRGQTSGLNEARRVLRDVRGVAFTEFDATDVVRHPLVARIVEAYERDAVRS